MDLIIDGDNWATSFCVCIMYNNSFKKWSSLSWCVHCWAVPLILYIIKITGTQNRINTILSYISDITIFSHTAYNSFIFSRLSFDFLNPLLMRLQIISFVFPTSSQTLQSFLFTSVWCFFLMYHRIILG